LLNKDNTVRVINNLISALIELRDDIANQNQDELNKKMQHAQEGRREWMKQRLANDWSAQGTKPQIPTSGEMLGRLIGLRPKSERKKKN
jgi:hypothetical protein